MQSSTSLAQTSLAQTSLSVATASLASLTALFGGLGLYAEPAFAEAVAQDGAWAAWTDLVFNAVSLLALAQPADPPTNGVFGTARVFSVLFALTAASTIIFSLSRSLRLRLSLGWIGLKSRRRPGAAHAVVIGDGPLSRPLIDDLRSAGRSVIAVPTGSAPGVRSELQSSGAVVLDGDARDADIRTRCRLGSAKEVFVTGGDDAMNLDVAGDILRGVADGTISREARTRKSRQADLNGARSPDPGTPGADRLSCYVHIGDAGYAGLFRGRGLFQSSGDAAEFHVFNARQRAARQLLLDPDTGLATAYAPGPKQVAHYVLFGFGPAGQAVALEAARLAHFSGLRRLRMTIVDDFYDDSDILTPAGTARRQFLARYPTFCPEPGTLDLADHARRSDTAEKDAWTCRDYRPACQHVQRESPAIEYVVNAEFIDWPADDPDIVPLLMERLCAPGDTPVAPAAVSCFADDGQSFQTVHRLRELLSPEADALPVPFPFFVYLPTEEGLAELTAGRHEGYPIHVFGSRQQIARYAQITRPALQDVARHLHEGYRTARIEEARPSNGESARIPEPWADLAAAYRLSNEDAAAHAAVKLRTLGYRWDPFTEAPGSGSSAPDRTDLRHHLPDAPTHHLARMEHNRFVAERLIGGWLHEDLPEGYDDLSASEQRAYNDEMRSRKRRPSFLPYRDLHGQDEPKDREQVETLFDALEALGLTPEYIGPAADGGHAPLDSEGAGRRDAR